MASIRERVRRDGSIAYGVLYKIDNRQSALTFDTRAEAEAFKSSVESIGAFRALARRGIGPDPRRVPREDKRLTVEEWVQHHIDHLTGVEQYTLDVYQRYLENDIRPAFGNVALVLLTEEHIAQWVQHMELDPSEKTGRPVTPKTIKNKHGFLSGALAAAVPKYIPSNPAAGRRLPRSTGNEDDSMRMLSRDEFGALLDATPKTWRVLMEFLVTSGCRWGEATALRPEDVHPENGTVSIRRAWKRSSNGYEVGPPKTKRSRRVINLPPEVISKLDLTHEWVFTSATGGPVRYHNFKPGVWDKAVTASGLKPKPTPHDLRHTCASWLLNAGVPITTVSRHLGHESIKITADVYGDVDRSSHEAAAEVMRSILLS